MGGGTSCLPLKEEHRLRVFKNRELGRTFGTNGESKERLEKII
jgi:hypothetical protein